jgi:hypothetical protein
MSKNLTCELELNFISLNTFGQWFQSLTINKIDDYDDDDDQENKQRSNIYNT